MGEAKRRKAAGTKRSILTPDQLIVAELRELRVMATLYDHLARQHLTTGKALETMAGSIYDRLAQRLFDRATWLESQYDAYLAVMADALYEFDPSKLADLSISEGKITDVQNHDEGREEAQEEPAKAATQGREGSQGGSTEAPSSSELQSG